VLLGLQGGVPPDPAMGQNMMRSSGANHFWSVRQSRPETPAEARIDSLVAINVTASDSTVRHATWRDVQRTLNDECFLIWLPVIRLKAPVRNTFGNLEPTAIPHRLLWNIDRVYWKGTASRT
jgi:ABC-type transport system substrate-binding protein